MEQEIKNKVVVITGAARGIGLAVADEILKEGADSVIAIDIKGDTGSDAIKILNSKYGANKAIFIKADITKDLDETFQVIIDKYKSVDILVNCAGIADETDVKRIIAINTTALIEWSSKFFNHMNKAKGGKGGTILNFSSIYGYAIDPCLPIYKASKFAVMGFSKTLGHVENYKISGVRVLALCPGYTHTEIRSDKRPSEILDLPSVDTIEFEKQDAIDVAKAAKEVVTKCATGTGWSIIGAKPIEEV